VTARRGFTPGHSVRTGIDAAQRFFDYIAPAGKMKKILGEMGISLRMYSLLAILYQSVYLTSGAMPGYTDGITQDTAWMKQQIHNGRIWENRYGKISGHEYFLTEALCESRVTVNGRIFEKQLLRYDILRDEVVLMVRPDQFIMLNSEHTVEFTIISRNREYRFVNFGEMGFYLVLYDGKTKLVRKYVKTVKKQSYDNLYATFAEETADFIVSDGIFHRLRNRSDLFRVMAGREKEVREYLRKSPAQFSMRRSESLIPVLEYFDSLSDSK
jgi:hypothetical protein